MSLVDLETLPFDLLQVLPVLENEFVRREEDVKLEVAQRTKFEFANDFARSRRPHVADDVEVGSPDAKLHLPCRYSRERHNNEKRAILMKRVKQVGQERDRLDGFAEAHFVREDSIFSLAPDVGEPVEAGELKWLERTPEISWIFEYFGIRGARVVWFRAGGQGCASLTRSKFGDRQRVGADVFVY